MPIACFQLSVNYGFTKTKDCPQTGIVGCLTPFPHVTRLSNSRIKIFYPSILDQEKCPFSSPMIGNKIKQSQVTNHTLEKPNDWWQLHLPLVISFKSTQNPFTHPRYDTPPYDHLSCQDIERHVSVVAMDGQVVVRRQHYPFMQKLLTRNEFQ